LLLVSSQLLPHLCSPLARAPSQKYTHARGLLNLIKKKIKMHTPHAASSAQIFLSVVTHKANHISGRIETRWRSTFPWLYRKHDDCSKTSRNIWNCLCSHKKKRETERRKNPKHKTQTYFQDVTKSSPLLLSVGVHDALPNCAALNCHSSTRP